LSFHDRAPLRRLLHGSCLLALALILSGCGGGSSRTIPTGTIGTTTGVALSTSTGTAQIQQGANFVVTATVTNDVNNAGVTWTLVGGGALTNVTTKTVTYTAPTGITGATTPLLTATSIHDTTKSATATLVVNGLPIIEPVTFFPGNVSIPYGAGVVLSGGLAPFTWTLSSGTLPAGITLGTTSTTSFVAISGTPTATGTYNFQVKAVDKNANAATVDLVLVINAAEACLLNGHYALLFTGFSSNTPTVGAAALTVTPTGTITGIQDYKTASATVGETVTGTCSTRTSNNGELKLVGALHSPNYDYATPISLQSGRIQLENGGDKDSGTGQFLVQDVSAFNQAALAGDYAFEALGAATNGARMGVLGALTLNATGTVTAGRLDANSATPQTAAAVVGTLGVPDANGRATLQLTAGAQVYKFAAYVVDANKLFLVSVDDNTAPRLAGFMTRRSGSFDTTSLANPAVLTLWGAGSGIPPAVLEMGRMSNVNTAAGTADFSIDRAEHASGALAEAYTGAHYLVDADGRFTLTLTLAASTTTRHFVGYLDGVSNGYLLETGGNHGAAGLLEAQMAGPFNGTIPGLFIGGTQFAQDAGPMVLLPAVHFSGGSFSASQGSGYYAMDAATGRGLGTISITGLGSAIFVVYQVAPDRVRTMRFGTISRSGTVEWYGH
jgi:hypothetical protein